MLSRNPAFYYLIPKLNQDHPHPYPNSPLLGPTSLGRHEGYENTRALFHKIRCLDRFLMHAYFFFIFQLCWRYKIDEYMYNTCYSHCINRTPIRPACSYFACFIRQKTLFSTQAC